jgi:hypothetical protein
MKAILLLAESRLLHQQNPAVAKRLTATQDFTFDWREERAQVNRHVETVQVARVARAAGKS